MTSPSSVPRANAPQAESRSPAPTSTTVHTAVSRRIPWTASASPSKATPDKRISPGREERVTSAPPLEITGIEGQGDRADDQIERHGREELANGQAGHTEQHEPNRLRKT